MIAAWRDFDGDRQQVSYDVAGTSTAVDFTGFVSELEKWNVGLGAGGGFYDDQALDPGGSASNPLAQNSLQAIIEMTDAVTGGVYTKRLPMPDLAKADDVGTNPAFIQSGGLTVFNPAHVDYGTLKTELETHMISPNGNAVTINRVYIEE